jgi:hypothetical protein
MTPEQEQHLATIKTRFSVLCDAKYRKGQKEHGGDLFAMCPLKLVDNALEEAIDQVVYLDTLRERIKEGL